jgi:hypothetical protein
MPPPTVGENAAGRVDARGGPPLDFVLLAGALILIAIPFLVLHHVNTIDGPAHVLGGRLLGSFRDLPIVRHYYVTSFLVVPNMLTQYLLTGLMTVVSPTWAEKLLVVGYILGFGFACRFAIRSVNPAAGWLALVSLPFVVNYMLLFGFYDFNYGMIGALVAIGLFLRGRGRWSPGRVIGVALVLVLTFAAHIVPLVMAVVVMATIVVCDGALALKDRQTADGGVRNTIRRVVLPPTLAVLPVVALTVAFLASGRGGGLATARKSWSSLVTGLATLTLPIVSYTKAEEVVSVITAAVLAVLLVAAIRAHRGTPLSSTTVALMAVVIVCIVVYFASPDVIGTGSFLNDRLSLFPPLMLLLACASLPRPGHLWRNAGVVILVGTLVMAGARLPTEHRYDQLADEYLSAARAIPPRVTLVSLTYSVFSPPIGDRRYKQLDPLASEASRIAADDQDVDLRHLEGLYGYYTARFRPRLQQLAHRYLDNFAVPPAVNLSGYESHGGHIDYVLVVGLGEAPAPVRQATATRAVERQLASRYVLVFTTKPTGLVQVYRHR